MYSQLKFKGTKVTFVHIYNYATLPTYVPTHMNITRLMTNICDVPSAYVYA